jgi:hypothetical protein
MALCSFAIMGDSVVLEVNRYVPNQHGLSMICKKIFQSSPGGWLILSYTNLTSSNYVLLYCGRCAMRLIIPASLWLATSYVVVVLVDLNFEALGGRYHDSRTSRLSPVDCKPCLRSRRYSATPSASRTGSH